MCDKVPLMVRHRRRRLLGVILVAMLVAQLPVAAAVACPHEMAASALAGNGMQEMDDCGDHAPKHQQLKHQQQKSAPTIEKHHQCGDGCLCGAALTLLMADDYLLQPDPLSPDWVAQGSVSAPVNSTKVHIRPPIA